MNARKGNARRLRTVTLNIRSIGVNTVNWGGGRISPLKKIVDCLFYTPITAGTYIRPWITVYLYKQRILHNRINVQCLVSITITGCDISPGIVYMRSHSTNLKSRTARARPAYKERRGYLCRSCTDGMFLRDWTQHVNIHVYHIVTLNSVWELSYSIDRPEQGHVRWYDRYITYHRRTSWVNGDFIRHFL